LWRVARWLYTPPFERPRWSAISVTVPPLSCFSASMTSSVVVDVCNVRGEFELSGSFAILYVQYQGTNRLPIANPGNRYISKNFNEINVVVDISNKKLWKPFYTSKYLTKLIIVHYYIAMIVCETQTIYTGKNPMSILNRFEPLRFHINPAEIFYCLCSANDLHTLYHCRHVYTSISATRRCWAMIYYCVISSLLSTNKSRPLNQSVSRSTKTHLTQIYTQSAAVHCDCWICNMRRKIAVGQCTQTVYYNNHQSHQALTN